VKFSRFETIVTARPQKFEMVAEICESLWKVRNDPRIHISDLENIDFLWVGNSSDLWKTSFHSVRYRSCRKQHFSQKFVSAVIHVNLHVLRVLHVPVSNPLIALFIDSFEYRIDEVLLIIFLSPWWICKLG
jgi:hypothetical protein